MEASIGDAMKGIGSGLCLWEEMEMGFAFGVEVIIWEEGKEGGRKDCNLPFVR